MAAPTTSRKAMAGLALTALACIFAFTDLTALFLPVAVAGLVLAFVALGDIRLSEGRLGGRRLAIAAILSQATLFFAAFVLAPCSYVMEATRRSRCHSHLKTLASAMHEYHDDHGTLPPHAIYSEDGTPLLSWRVLLLPYLDEGELYEEFRLDEPWDGPHNARLLARRPTAYAAPGVWPGGGPRGTFYQVFIGEGAAFEGRKGLRLPQDFPDGLSNTILIVEAGEAVPWTKPEDLPYAADRPLPELGGLRLRGGFLAALADGSIRSISKRISEETLRAAITRNGNDTLGPDW